MEITGIVVDPRTQRPHRYVGTWQHRGNVVHVDVAVDGVKSMSLHGDTWLGESHSDSDLEAVGRREIETCARALVFGANPIDESRVDRTRRFLSVSADNPGRFEFEIILEGLPSVRAGIALADRAFPSLRVAPSGEQADALTTGEFERIGGDPDVRRGVVSARDYFLRCLGVTFDADQSIRYRATSARGAEWLDSPTVRPVVYRVLRALVLFGMRSEAVGMLDALRYVVKTDLIANPEELRYWEGALSES